jgi:hypothetical protein
MMRRVSPERRSHGYASGDHTAVSTGPYARSRERSPTIQVWYTNGCAGGSEKAAATMRWKPLIPRSLTWIAPNSGRGSV